MLKSLLLSTCCLMSLAAAELRLDGGTITTPRQTITVADSGLPAQIVIAAAPEELPLPLRSGKAAPSDAELMAIGRGPQLRAPVRLEATIEGKRVAATAAAPLTPSRDGNDVVVAGTLTAGGLRLGLDLRYSVDGVLAAAVTVGPRGATCEALDVVFDLVGSPDCVVVGAPLADQPRAYTPGEFALPPGEGVVWTNLGSDTQPQSRRVPGLPSSLFLGDGDRGLVILPQGSTADWGLDEALPTALIERQADGALSLRLRLVNRPGGLASERTLRLSVHALPAALPAADRRRSNWLTWAHGDTVANTLDRSRAKGAVRADVATLLGIPGTASVISGAAGAVAHDDARDASATYPAVFFRFLAATHTGLDARLVPEARTRPGMRASGDRIALGRALVNDCGVDPRGLVHAVGALRVVEAMHTFGLFADDGQTEFLPWWRNGELLRYGTPMTSDDPFAITTEDPLARVHVTAYRRPGAAGSKEYQVLIVVLNEGDQAVREPLYLRHRGNLLGGANRQTAANVAADWDTAHLPEQSDWGLNHIRNHKHGGTGRANRSDIVLRDLEDDGVVQLAAVDGQLESYGPVHVPPRDFRIFFATARKP